MKLATTITLMVIRVAGLIQIVTGLTFWTGNALFLIPLHMLVGLLVVLSLWVLAGLAARAGVEAWRVAVAAVWGLFVVIFGLVQTQLLPGEWHWVIRLLHLLVGVVALGLGDRLAGEIRRRAPASEETGRPALAGGDVP